MAAVNNQCMEWIQLAFYALVAGDVFSDLSQVLNDIRIIEIV